MKRMLILILISLALFVYLQNSENPYLKDTKMGEKNIINQNDQKETIEKNININYKTTMDKYMGLTKENVVKNLGLPQRIDKSSYGYEWYVYNLDYKKYVQIGIMDNKVVTLFAIGEEVPLSKIKMGASYETVKKQYELKDEYSFFYKMNRYTFKMNEQNKKVFPLSKVDNNWAILYFDKFENKLSAIRYVNSDILLKMRPYDLFYNGKLPEYQTPNSLTWSEIEKGEERQIFEVTNVIRKQFLKKNFKWNEKVAQVAKLHSKDMYDHNYFDHVSPYTGTLADRLKNGNIEYRLGGENIAAKYTDGLAALEGWLNSEGHRKALLSDEFEELGVGNYEKYFTQDFITKN